MAVRATVSGDHLSKTTGTMSGTGANFSASMWLKRKSGNGFATGYYFRNPTTNLEMWMELASGNTNLTFFEDPAVESVVTGPAMTVDVWYFFLIARSNTSRSLYYGTEAGGTLTKVTNTDTRNSNSGTVGEVWIFDDIYTEFFNGEGAYARCWDATLSDAEADAEWRSTTPVRTANLRGDWRLASAATATTDSSGNGLTLTAAGTLTDGGANPTPPAAGSFVPYQPEYFRSPAGAY